MTTRKREWRNGGRVEWRAKARMTSFRRSEGFVMAFWMGLFLKLGMFVFSVFVVCQFVWGCFRVWLLLWVRLLILIMYFLC